MNRFLLLISITFSALFSTELETKHFDFTDEFIDVVIPCVEKDLPILELCIEGIKTRSDKIRRVIVVSKNKLTENAEWFCEEDFPFSYQDVKRELILENPRREASLKKFNRTGWYYQQLLKFYAPYTIPDISTNVLILDADTIFKKPVSFLDENNIGLYSYSLQDVGPYYAHAKRLVPGYKKFKDISGICHHMLFQKPILDSLFNLVETAHKKPFWKAFCHSISDKDLYFSGASEYEIYFHYLFNICDQVKIRKLKNKDLYKFEDLLRLINSNYDFVSVHNYDRAGD